MNRLCILIITGYFFTNCVYGNSMGMTDKSASCEYSSSYIYSTTDGDGIAESSETVKVAVYIHNNGTATLNNLVITLSSSDTHIDIVDPPYHYPLPFGPDEFYPLYFDIHITADCPTGNVAFTVTMTADEGSWQGNFGLEINPAVPYLICQGFVIDDDNEGESSGDGDGKAEPGETFELKVTAYNSGHADATDGSCLAYFISSPADLDIIKDTANTPIIPVGTSFELSAFIFHVGPRYNGWNEEIYLIFGENGWDHIFLYIENYPKLEYYSHVIDDDTIGNSYGDGDGIVEPGEIIEVPVSLINNGYGYETNANAVFSTDDPDVTIVNNTLLYSAIDFDSVKAPSGGEFVFSISENCPEKDIPFYMNITSGSDYISWTDSFAIHVEGLEENVPCENAALLACFCENDPAVYAGGENGSWNSDRYDICGFMTPGIEQVYSFKAPVTADFYISILSAEGYVDYSYKESTCNSANWTCIGDIDTAGVTGPLSFHADSTYYILLDDEDIIPGTHTFYIMCPDYARVDLNDYAVDDDDIVSSGDNDGYAEPGETIELIITVKNTGNLDAHTVVSELSASAPEVIITDSTENWGDLSAGSDATTSAFLVEASSDLSEYDITFTLETNSEEGSWTDEFVVHFGTPTKLRDNLGNPDITIFPNPATGTVHIDLRGLQGDHLSVQLYDQHSLLLDDSMIRTEGMNGFIQLTLPPLSRGIYYVRLVSETLQYTGKVVIL
jgi:hypothetical protein